MDGGYAAPAQSFSIVHFNDVYHIGSFKQEPVGGAARFKTAISQVPGDPLVIFSGDAYNPSLASTATKGAHMVPVLNSFHIDCAAYGNHDFDFGVEVAAELAEQCNFPWLLSNVHVGGRPPGKARRAKIVMHKGIKIGFIGLAEQEWLELMPKPPAGIVFEDPVAVARELNTSLRAKGCQLVVAITHMRLPNDVALAEAVPELDLVLGGHDHFYKIEQVGPVTVCKSGTDFREFSVIDVAMPSQPGQRITTQVRRVEVDSSFAEDPEVKVLVDSLESEVAAKYDVPVARTETALDATVEGVRTRESNLGDLTCSVMRLRFGTELCLIAGGTFRSGRMYGPGEITIKDILNVFPFSDPMVTIRMTGRKVVEALENGVSKYPKHDGRFLQVSGLRFSFDPARPPNSRVVRVTIGPEETPIDLDREYTVATREYMRAGHDGFVCMQDCPVMMPAEAGPLMSTVLRMAFMEVSVINAWKSLQRFVAKAIHAFKGARQCPVEDYIVIKPLCDGRIHIVGGDDSRSMSEDAPPAAATNTVSAGSKHDMVESPSSPAKRTRMTVFEQ